MKYIYIIYQALIALPIIIVVTIVTALITIIAIPWHNAEWLHKIQMFWARCFCWLMFIPVEVRGLENIQKGQSYVFVSNHQSAFDIFVIYGYLPVIFKWLMKQELRKVPFVGTACAAAGHIFIDRKNPQAAIESIHRVEAALVNGVSTVIFPEGTRSKDGQVGRFKRGAFQVALDLHLPIIPISLNGCYEVMNRSAWHVTRHPITMTIGKPIDLQAISNSLNGEQSTISNEAIELVRQAVVEGC
ncbi:MAG: 1-acyl-sn-glycerol-3-phosphate acyltransferase [Paludibacteraceae bacterium]|nr:1-acyl-sn-glycerol-3-phosphate acyltransferase [Paludibacteraceae bacterium]